MILAVGSLGALTALATDLAIVVGVDAKGQTHGGARHGSIVQAVAHEGGGLVLLSSVLSTTHPLPRSVLHGAVAGTKTHGPVDQIEHKKHDGEHNKEHIINF